jgi:hypothetical protein
MHCQKIAFGNVEISIFQIPTVLEGHVLLRAEGDEYI